MREQSERRTCVRRSDSRVQKSHKRKPHKRAVFYIDFQFMWERIAEDTRTYKIGIDIIPLFVISVLPSSDSLSLNLFHHKSLKDIVFLDIVELFKANTTFVTGSNLFCIVLEALE